MTYSLEFALSPSIMSGGSTSAGLTIRGSETADSAFWSTPARVISGSAASDFAEQAEPNPTTREGLGAARGILIALAFEAVAVAAAFTLWTVIRQIM